MAWSPSRHASLRRPWPSEPGEMAVDCGKTSRPMPKALSPVPSLRRRRPGARGEMAVDCVESGQSKAEGAEPGAQPKEVGAAGPGARWPSTAWRAGSPRPKALIPVPSLRRWGLRGQGRDGRRQRGKLAVQGRRR